MYNKLNQIQTELKAPKSKEGTGIRFKYRSCSDILEALKPHLIKHKVTLLINDEVVEVAGRFYVKATVTLTDGEKEISTSALAREPETQNGMGLGQLSGATSSYARKYALSGLFCIDDTEDLDNAEDFSEVNNINTIEDLKAYYTANIKTVKNKKAFDKLISDRKEVLSATA